MKEREKKWKKLKGMHYGRLGKELYEGDVLGRRPRGQPGKRRDDSFK